VGTVPELPKAPPGWLIDGIGRVREGLGELRRSVMPANVAVLELVQGAWLTQTMYAAAKLGIFDVLATAPASAADVARQVGSQPEATDRLMRALASNSFLTRRRDGKFALTRLGRALRSDAPGSIAPLLLYIGHPKHWEHWGQLLYSVQTGETSVQMLRGMPIFEYLETDSDLAETFNHAMTGVSGMAIETLMPAYDFRKFGTIVDVGGGHGALLSAALQQAPDARGVLFDLPSVVAGATALLEAAGVSDRTTVTGGSFFESVPAGGDAYLLKTIIHDWDEDSALAILRNVRDAIAPGGTLALIELVLPEGTPFHPGMLLDMEMLVTAGGRERTASEYAELLSRAGFRQTRVVSTAGPMSLVEAVPS
jgi:hypothetical protein